MKVKPAIPGLGFDVNQPLSGAQAAAFKAAGHTFCIRYIPRTPALVKGNLTAIEIAAILGAGLALMAVQHVPQPGWEPSAALGTSYGEYAAQYAASIAGLPKRMNLWMDLEEVSKGATAQEVSEYCHAWAAAVEVDGYVPGIYVGWNVKLTDQQLYLLPFKHYWRAYNCDQSIPGRGYQIVQKPQQTLDGITFDPNQLQADSLGDVPMWLVAE